MILSTSRNGAGSAACGRRLEGAGHAASRVELIGQLLGDREDRTLVDASRIEGDLGQRQGQCGQPIMALLLLQRTGGLDRELARPSAWFCLIVSPGTFKATDPAAAV